MIHVERSIVINRPAGDVARYLADIERQTEWTDMTASRKLTDGPLRMGTQAYAEVAMGPVKLGWTWRSPTSIRRADSRIGRCQRARWAWTEA